MVEEYEKSHEQGAIRPWIVLKTTYDVEAWIDHQNRAIQQLVRGNKASGWGICFGLSEGEEIFLHTTSEGDVILDVTAEAEWVTPLISAATRVAMPTGQIWALPGDRLTQLVFGLNSLIATTRLVGEHNFNLKKRY